MHHAQEPVRQGQENGSSVSLMTGPEDSSLRLEENRSESSTLRGQ